MSKICSFSWATIPQVFTKLSYSDPLFCRFLRPETKHSLVLPIRIFLYDFSQATFQLFDVLTAFCFIGQSNNFKHSYKCSDWTKLACFIRVYSNALMTPQLHIRAPRFENKVEFLKKITCSLSLYK